MTRLDRYGDEINDDALEELERPHAAKALADGRVAGGKAKHGLLSVPPNGEQKKRYDVREDVAPAVPRTRAAIHRARCQEIRRILSSEGMSTRAIAPIVGVHHDTVAEDLKPSVGNPTLERPATARGPVVTAGEQLQQALQRLADDRTPPPCTGDYLWLSERHEDREAASYRCQPCPVLHLCHAFASTAKPPITFGTFGGIDYTATTRRAVS